VRKPKGKYVLSHKQIWTAIDALAARHSISVSALARKSGLDPTTFNKSKRAGIDGRKRWPSTESLAKAMEAVNEPLDSFLELVGFHSEKIKKPLPIIPLLPLSQAGDSSLFDAEGLPNIEEAAGVPSSAQWDGVEFPALGEQNMFALEVDTEAYAPLYREGTHLIVTPKLEDVRNLRRADRVMIIHQTEGVLLGEIRRLSAKNIEIRDLGLHNTEHNLRLEEITRLAQILWASQ
jgi:phage repressor protein C with HTH and peptisase S24 domain